MGYWIKLAGLEALALEELEKHVTQLLSLANIWGFSLGNRDACGVESLRIRDSKSSESGTRGHYVDAINSLLHLARERKRVNKSTRWLFPGGENHFQRDNNIHVTPRKGNGKKGNQIRSWSQSAGKGRGKTGQMDNPKENPKVPRMLIVRTRVKFRRQVNLILKTRNQSYCLQRTSRFLFGIGWWFQDSSAQRNRP